MITVDAVVVGAMDEEVRPYELLAAHTGAPQEVAGARGRLVTVGAADILLVRSGIGLVNAASAAVAAITSVKARALVSTGSAGGLDDRVRPGTVVAGDTYAYTGADARAFGYAIGQVPGMPAAFGADPAMLERVRDRPDVVVGQMVSGDTFVDAVRVDSVRTVFPRAVATDMESTALAQVAHSYGLPFLSVRGVSDMCGPAAGAEHAVSVDEVSGRAAAVVLGALGA